MLFCLLQAQDVVDALYQANDDRLPGYQVSKPIQQLPIHDMRPLPAVSVLKKKGYVLRAAKAGPGDGSEGWPRSSLGLPTLPAAPHNQPTRKESCFLESSTQSFHVGIKG